MIDTVTILNRLKLWMKLLIVGLVFTVPLVLTTFFLLEEKNIKIHFADDELRGVTYIRPLTTMLEHVVVRRLELRRLSSGDASARARISDLDAAIERDFTKLNDVDAQLGDALETSLNKLRGRQREDAFPGHIRAAWDKVRSMPLDTDSAEAHARLIVGIRALISHVGDLSKLILDPDLDTYYVMDALLLRTPQIADRAGIVTEKASSIVLRKNVPFDERAALAGEIAILEMHAGEMANDAMVAINEIPNFSKHGGLEPALTGPMGEVSEKTRRLADLARRAQTPDAPLDLGELAAAARDVVAANGRYWTVLLDQEQIMLGIRRGADVRRRNFALGSVIAVLSLSIFLTILILRSVTIPIRKAVDVANQLSRGELPDRIEVGDARDETAVLLSSINDMLKFLDLRRTIGTLKTASETLETAITELEAQSKGQDRAATLQATALQETQVTSQEIRQTSRLAAEKAQAVLQIAERAETVSRTGEAAVGKTLGGLSDSRTLVLEIAQKVDDLAQRTQQIGLITQTVKDLADQSNMLALNAAIEAVRSGEHGKGFAVVAREIRSLADQSIQATHRVNDILERVSSSIREVVGIADRGRQRMEASLIDVHASGESLKELSEIVRESSQSARQIAAAVSQQDAGVNQMVEAITDQSSLMDETVKRAEGIRLVVNKVAEASGSVAETVSRFNASA